MLHCHRLNNTSNYPPFVYRRSPVFTVRSVTLGSATTPPSALTTTLRMLRAAAADRRILTPDTSAKFAVGSFSGRAICWCTSKLYMLLVTSSSTSATSARRPTSTSPISMHIRKKRTRAHVCQRCSPLSSLVYGFWTLMRACLHMTLSTSALVLCLRLSCRIESFLCDVLCITRDWTKNSIGTSFWSWTLDFICELARTLVKLMWLVKCNKEISNDGAPVRVRCYNSLTLLIS